MAVQNSLAKSKKMDFSAYITQDAAKRIINKTLGGKSGTRFISSIASAVQATPALQECTNLSILSAALLGEALNLSPSPQLGQFYMVPYKNKGVLEAQFQLGYKGYIQLAVRSGYYKRLNVMAIKEGELVRYDPLSEEIEVNLIEDDIIREDTPTTGYFAMFEYENGFKKTMYWSKQKMLSHADKYSQAFHMNAVDSDKPSKRRVSYEDYLKGNYPEDDAWKYSSFWYKDFDGMAMKTMLRQLISKWGIMSIDLQTALDKDMAVLHEDGSADYVDNGQDHENVVAEQEMHEVTEEHAEESAVTGEQPNAQQSGNQMSLEDEFFSQHNS